MKLIACPLERHARKSPDAPAVISGKTTLSFRELDGRIKQMEAKLKAAGIRSGERVGLLSDKSIEVITVLYALWRIKAVAVVLNLYLPNSAINAQLKKLAVKRLISSKARQKKGLTAKIVPLKKLASLKAPAPKAGSPYQFQAERVVTVLFTSGTSGEAKAAVHSFGNYVANAKGSNTHLPLKPGDRWLLSLPLYHVGGLSIIFRSFLAGAAVVIQKKKRYSLKEMRDRKITHLSLVPTQLYRLMEENTPKAPPGCLKAVLLGGAPIPSSLIKRAVKGGWPMYTTYGLTEMTSQVATSSKITSVNQHISGKILPHARVKVNKDGQILVKGPALFKGYAANGRLRRPLTKGGWFETGDLGRIVYKDRLVVTGRRGNMFISGGENIQPEEIEKHLLSIPNIRNACIVPKISPEFGERPVAILQPEKGKKLKREAIETYLAKKIEKYKVPDEYYYWPGKAASESLKFSRAKLLSVYTNKRDQLIRIN